jgi:catechol 2,3-dioxygenase-like lactoylglutathione lyase family enzyme
MSEPKMDAVFHHVAASVRDIDATVSFFTNHLGFEVDWDHDHRSGRTMDAVVGLKDADARMVMLKGYGARLELFHYHHPQGRDIEPLQQCDYGLTHFCFSVNGIHELYERLVKAGVDFNCPPQNLRPGVWCTYLKGPEGITIELVQYDQPQ